MIGLIKFTYCNKNRLVKNYRSVILIALIVLMLKQKINLEIIEEQSIIILCFFFLSHKIKLIYDSVYFKERLSYSRLHIVLRL